MKQQEQLLATELRKQGKSFTEILKHVSVSRGTLSLWLKKVPLTEEQKYHLFVTLRMQTIAKIGQKKTEARQRKTKAIVELAESEVETNLSHPLFLAGVMLYWAEGDKSNEAIKFSNSDPQMIRLMMRWFREICLVPEKKFRIALHIHELHNQSFIENCWSQITGISKKQFHKTQIKPTSLGHRKKYLYNGTCSIRIGGVELFRKMHGWRLGVIKHLSPPADQTPTFIDVHQPPAWMTKK